MCKFFVQDCTKNRRFLKYIVLKKSFNYINYIKEMSFSISTATFIYKATYIKQHLY